MPHSGPRNRGGALRVNGGDTPFNPAQRSVVPLDLVHLVALPFALVSLVDCLGSH